jgi:hypothetical protein
MTSEMINVIPKDVVIRIKGKLIKINKRIANTTIFL